MVTRSPVICDSCAHLSPETRDAYIVTDPTCAAYPTGIPDAIWIRGEDHREFRGDETNRLKHRLDEDRAVFLRAYEGFVNP